MENSEIRELLQKRRYKPIKVTETKKFYMKKDLELILEYFEKMKKENPNMSVIDMQEKFIDEQYEILVDFSKSANIRGKYFQYKAAKELIKDSKKLEEMYCQLKKERKEKYKNGIYNANNENNYKVLIEDMRYALGHRFIPKETIRFSENYKNASNKEKREIESNLSNEERRVLEVLVNTTTEDEVTNIRNLIIALLPDIEGEIKKDLINSMKSMGRFFEQFNFVERYKSLNSSKLKGMGLSELEQPLYKDRFGKKEIELNQLFSEEVLEQYSVEDLLVLNAFWQNRFAKETERINNAIFALVELGILENGDKTSYTNWEMELIETKTELLKGISAIVSTILNKKNQKKNSKGEYENETIDVRKEVEAVLDPFQKRYDDYIYEKTGKTGNNLADDYINYSLLYNQLENAYKCKNSTMINILSMIYDDKSKTNWGYIADEMSRSKNDSKFLLIGIDYEGMNMPVRLHIERSLIKDFLKCRGEKMELPVYEGAEDFTHNGNVIPTQILMPASNKYKKCINECLKKRNLPEDQEKMLYHLRYIKDHDKYPEHLKNRPKKIINIQTGKIEEKNKGKDEER